MSANYAQQQRKRKKSFQTSANIRIYEHDRRHARSIIMQSFIIYALIDPRTFRVRYIGKSQKGVIRPLSHRSYQHSAALSAWLYDLKACRVEYTTLILAETDDPDYLAGLEAHWINVGFRFGWPLVNKHVPEDPLKSETAPGKHRALSAWRKDPEVKAALAKARLSRKPGTRIS